MHNEAYLRHQKGLVLQYQLHNRVENDGKVFNPVVKLVLENQPFLMPEPAEKLSLHYLRQPLVNFTEKWLHYRSRLQCFSAMLVP